MDLIKPCLDKSLVLTKPSLLSLNILIPAPLPNDGLTLVIKSSSARTLELSEFSINNSTKSAPRDIP